ncbi:unnamed protein product, partial [Prorocentrum cordatum]
HNESMMRHSGIKPPTTKPKMATTVDDDTCDHTQTHVVDSEGEITIDGVPINEHSLDSNLPSGPQCTSLLIRATINNYTARLCLPGWLDSFKLGTVLALARKLSKYKMQILGHSTFDMQVAVLQLEARLQALIDLFKAVKAWLGAQDEALLAECMPHFSIVLGFMDAKDTTMAEDACTVYAYATSQSTARYYGSVQRALKMMPSDFFSRLSSMSSMGHDVPDASAEEGPPPRQMRQQAKPKFLKLQMGAELLKDSAKTTGVAGDFHSILKIWNEKLVKKTSRDLEATFTNVLPAIHVIAQCSLPLERSRPIMVSYVAPKMLMEIPRLHVQQSAEDSTATSSFTRALQHFEKTSGAAFNDIEPWRDTLMGQCDGNLNIVKVRDLSIHAFWDAIGKKLDNWKTLLTDYRSVNDALQNAADATEQDREHWEDQLRPVTCDLKDIEGKLDEYQNSLTACADLLADMHNRWWGCMMAFLSRAGSKASGKFDEADLSKVYFELVLENTAIQLKDFTGHIKLAIARMAFISMAQLRKDINLMGTRCFRIAKCTVTEESVVKEVIEQMQSFIGNLGDWGLGTMVDTCGVEGSWAGIPGDGIYHRGADQLVESAMASVELAPRFTASEIHKEVISGARAPSIFQVLFRDVTSLDYLRIQELSFGAEVGTDQFAKLARNVAQKSLIDFANASSLSTIPMPTCVCLRDDNVKDMPQADALVLIELSNKTRDLSACCASLQGMLFKNVAGMETMAIDEDTLRDVTIYFQVAVASNIVKLDKALNSEAALALEGNGWEIPLDLQSLRGRLSNVACFCRKATDQLLEITAGHLQVLADKCKESIPPSGAAFNQGKMDVEMASRIFSDTLGNVIQQYTALHKCLSRTSSAGRVLNATSDAQNNEITSQAVAVGIEMLARGEQANQAVVMMRGATLLTEVGNKPDGGAKAEAFLKKHRIPKNDAILEAFWSELVALSHQCCSGGAVSDVGGDKYGGGDVKSQSGSVFGGSSTATPAPKQKQGSSAGSAAKYKDVKTESAEDALFDDVPPYSNPEGRGHCSRSKPQTTARK